MGSLMSMFGIMGPIFIIVGLGVLFRRLNWLTQEADDSLLKMVVNLLLPCLVFHSVLGNSALERVSAIIGVPFLGIFAVTIGYLIAIGLSGFFGLKSAVQKKSYAVSIGFFNAAFIPIPLTLALFGRETLGILCVFIIGTEAVFWTLISRVGTESSKIQWRKTFSPPLIAILLGLLFNLTKIGNHIPDFILKTVEMLGVATIPLVLLLVGAIVADIFLRERSNIDWKLAGSACGLRLFIIPLIFLGLAFGLPLPIELKRVLVVQAAMPSGISSIAIVKHFGGDSRIATMVVLSTYIIGIVTMPLWIWIGLSWLERI